MSKSDNVVSELLGAIDTVVGKRLQQLPYDKTIICTIVDDSNAKNGEYKVSDGSVKFSAKCENANYRVDDQVRVSVPNGDTTQEKFILGKYVKNNSTTPITYMSPLSSVLQMSGNLCGSNSSIYGLQAKGTGAREEIMLWSASVDDTDMAMLGNAIYDILYVQADFKTILSNYNITSGTYGLELRLGTTLAEGQPGPAITCVYDSTQMMGNPYAFGIYTTQAAKFDITNISNITSMQLWFYQDGNFKHITHSPDPRPIPADSDINNILIKNIQIGFGSDLQNVADETVKLFTTDSLFFDQTSKVNTKRLQFAWYNKDENGKYIGFDDGAFDESYDEDDYLQRAGRNDALKAQKNYDIPMDEIGLRLAANVKSAKEILSVISTKLSVDLFELVNKFQSRCNIAPYEERFKTISAFITAQAMRETNGKTTLKDVVNDMQDWYMNALNMAAVKYNTSILPTQIEGEWQFKYQGTVPVSLEAPAFYDNLSDYFNDLEQLFYGADEENPVFLGDLLEYVTGDYTGYKGIYDDFNRRITKFFAEYRGEWERGLELLSDGEDAIEAYFSSGYNFNPWVEEDLTADANKYCIYWYRYSPDADGDNFVSKGWQRITTESVDTRNGISVNLDATTMAKEQFKVLVIFNHEKYESNVLTFENQSTVIPAGIATLSDRIIIKHGTNSQESYQNYSSANTLVNGSDRFVSRELSIELLQGESGTPNNDILQNAQIYWYVPDNATMLTFETVDLQKLNTENDFVNDIVNPDKTADRQKAGYTCFYKTIGHGLAQAEDYIKDLKFCYRIKEYYVPTATQNTIICEVVKDEKTYESEITMNFSSFGTSGTDYTLTVAPATRQAALTPSNTAEAPWMLNIALYDNKNQEIDVPNISVKNIVTGSRYWAEIVLDEESGKYQCQVSLEPISDTKNVLCGILEFKIEDFQNVNEDQVALTMYYPIPYSNNTGYYIEGASTVVYDSQGGNPIYYKDAYCLYNQDEGAVVTNGTWSMQYTPGGSNEDSTWLTTKAYLPTLVNNALKPANMWVDGGDCTFNEAGEKVSHCAYVQYTNASNEVLWSQPILIMQNRYPSPMLNAWDGKFEINEENGTIMSTMVGAGKKNTDNTFSGVLMGDVEAAANLDNKTGLGVYGFNHGAQSFGLNIDGTAFFGKAGRGRILIDGNSGTISSASYQQNRGDTKETNTAGMMIDLDDGFIDMKGTAKINDTTYASNGTQSQIHLDVKSPYFYIKSKDGKELIHIGDEGNDLTPNYFLQTNDYQTSALWDDATFNIEGTPGAGMKIDLAQGKIQAYNFELRGEDSRPIDDDHKTLGSYLHLASTPEDMIRVHYRHNDFDTNGIDVLSVGSSNYILRSFNWWDTESGRDSTKIEPLTGMKIDLGVGTIEAYAENGADPLNWFRIDASDDSTVPLAIGDRTNPAFKVHWNGAFTINEENDTQFAFKVDENGNLSLGSGKFKVDKDGNVAIGGYGDTNNNGQKDNTEHYAFYISQDGQLNVQGRNFEVTPSGRLSLGSDKFVVDEGGNLTIAGVYNTNQVGEKVLTSYAFRVENDGDLFSGNGAFQVTKAGQLTIGSNVFKVTPAGVLTVNETDDGYAFKVDAEGNLSLGNGMFEVDKDGNLSLGAEKTDDQGNTFSTLFISQAGALNINNTAFSVSVDGDLSIGDGNFTVDHEGNLSLGENGVFQVSKDGYVTATSGDIGGAKIVDGKLMIPKGNIESLDITDLSMNNTKITPQSVPVVTDVELGVDESSPTSITYMTRLTSILTLLLYTHIWWETETASFYKPQLSYQYRNLTILAASQPQPKNVTITQPLMHIGSPGSGDLKGEEREE